VLAGLVGELVDRNRNRLHRHRQVAERALDRRQRGVAGLATERLVHRDTGRQAEQGGEQDQREPRAR
jgi:hypothetical protein